ncbi:capsule assembly Wzi family protein [Geothrix oryzisoli]|uniref:capsule assembly Wzi family protein n=1 Tax=Geothrix oryzisoli TaxID=2922721 RepID=UPI001FAD2724|nr:capsule assembly Wzi family protein [Geothrix oryzisoli]
MTGRGPRTALLGLVAGMAGWAQAPMLQDGAVALRQARTAWTLGEAPLPPLALPSFEVGFGGAGSAGAYAPLLDGEGMGHGIQGWGLGLQGRYAAGGWSFSATLLALRSEGRTLGVLHRAALAYQWESGWRLALEQGPFAWGSGLSGGDLLGDSARPFPRLSLASPEAPLPFGRWRAEVFLGQLERDRPIPAWIPDRAARVAAQTSGWDLHRPDLVGGLLRATFGTQVEASLGAVTMTGGRGALGQPAPAAAARTTTLADLSVRVPALARLVHAQGASFHVSRSAAPEDRSITLDPPRDLGGLRLVWEGWEVGVEYAGAASPPAAPTFTQPAHLAGFSTYGDPLGPAFGRDAVTRTVELGLPLPLEGQGRLRVVRATAALDHPAGTGSWFAQGDVQWRTPTGRIGGSIASRRDEFPGSPARWGWTFSVFQSFRVF